MTTPADELRAAADKLRALIESVNGDIATNPYWASDEHPPHAYPSLYARGVDNGLGGPSGAFAATMHPGVGELLAKVFDAWSRMGSYDPDLLHRVGGDETIALARAILDSQP